MNDTGYYAAHPAWVVKRAKGTNDIEIDTPRRPLDLEEAVALHRALGDAIFSSPSERAGA